MRKLIIVIDLGHGGHDPGALGKNSNEKTNVLNVGLALGRLLERAGHTVIYTRKSDKFLSLSERANIANRNKADIFISLHNNSAASDKATGFETFIYNGNVSNDTIKLQNSLHNAIAKGIGIVDRGKKRANFAVVRQTNMPAVLIEYAFINNPSDEKILINQVNKLAQLTADGINIYAGGKASKPTVSKPSTSKPKPKPQKPSNQTNKSNLTVDGKAGTKLVEALQKATGSKYTDGTFSSQPSNDVTKAFYSGITFGSKGSPSVGSLQKYIGEKVDNKLGPSTIRTLQRRLGTPVDGKISRPYSPMIAELQRRLNNGTF